MAARKKTLPNIEHLKQTIAELQPDRKEIAEKLYTRLEFMNETLDQLQEQIREDGPTRCQGETVRENPALKAYNTTIQRYSLLYKQLTDLLPKAEEKPPDDPLINFIKGARNELH